MTVFNHKLPITDISVLKQLLPQREPMIMVDSLISFTEDSLTSRFTITSANIFVKDNHFQEAGLLENMAQTVALHTGYKGILSGEKPREGYIGAIKKATFKQMPVIGDTIETNAVITYSAMEMTMVDVSVFLKGEVIASATMTTILKPESNEA
jgi:3-hydroxymyristoyl/3-hydroxydecanoyl-(acyl carrier protein) dehydratase